MLSNKLFCCERRLRGANPTFSYGILICFFTFFVACSDRQETNSNKSEFTQAKESLFDDPDKLISVLSQNGIGELKPWQNATGLGWGSLSDDFEFGKKRNAHGFRNSIGYLIEGSEQQAQKVGISLYIYNPSEKKVALNFLGEIADRTLNSLGVTRSKDIRNAILSAQQFRWQVGSYIVSNQLEKAKAEIWTISIERR